MGPGPQALYNRGKITYKYDEIEGNNCTVDTLSSHFTGCFRVHTLVCWLMQLKVN